jgi:hypothetical protein
VSEVRYGEDVTEVQFASVSVAFMEESLAEIGGRLIFGSTKSECATLDPVSPRVMAALNRALEDKPHEELSSPPLAADLFRITTS